MKTKTICAGILLTLSLLGAAQAQTTRELAYTLAEITVDQSFKDIKPILDMAFSNLEKQANAEGNKDRTVSIFIEEMKNAMNRENFIQVIGDVLARDMTSGELQEALNFVNSPTGRKFTKLSDTVKDTRNLMPILKMACDRAKTRARAVSLSTTDLDRTCARFQ